MQREVEELEANLKVCEKERERLIAERKGLKGFETVGMIVTHRTRGIGMVTAVKGNIIHVDYENGDKDVSIRCPMYLSKDILCRNLLVIMITLRGIRSLAGE